MASDAVPVGRVARFNERIAVRSTVVFGSMWMTYVFLLYGLLPLLAPSALTWALYVSNCVQLFALPLLAVGQNVLGRGGERRAQETHDMVQEELALLREEIALRRHPAEVPPA